MPSSMHLRLSSHFEIFEWVRNSKAIFCLCKGAKVCNCHLWSECMTSFSQKKCWAPARHHHLAARHQLVVLPLWCPAPRYIWFFFRKDGRFPKRETVFPILCFFCLKVVYHGSLLFCHLGLTGFISSPLLQKHRDAQAPI